MFVSLYEDPELVARMRLEEAMEEEMINQTFLPAGFEGLIASVAAQVQAQKPPVRKAKLSLLSMARKEVEGGLLPGPVEIKSEANLSYNKHMAKLYEFAKAGLRSGVEDYPLTGTNTYAKAVKGYRDLLLEYLDKTTLAHKPEVSKVATAQPKAPAKKINAAAVAMKSPTSKSVAKPAKTPTTKAKARKAPAKKK